MKIDEILEVCVGYVWGMPLVVFIVGSGFYFLIRSVGLPFRMLPHAVGVLSGKYSKDEHPGVLSHFQALAAALGGTVGLGNIAGVAWAIVTGGPGAMVWMWLIGVVGMATRFFTCTLAVSFRKQLSDGTIAAGPMHVIDQALSSRWRFLAVCFSFFVLIASFGGGNMFQSNQIGVAMNYYFGIPKWIVGLVLSIVVGLVVIGGIRRIGVVAAKLVPSMCLLYVLGSFVVIALHISEIPRLLALIFHDAFTGSAVAGGVVGAVIKQGVRRAVFSSESGLGSAPIAHGTAKTDQPVRHGLVSMLDPLIDTLIVCTATALVVTISGIYENSELVTQAAKNSDLKGIIVTTEAFNQSIPGFGKYFVSIAVFVFGLTSIISWAYYGEQGCRYLLGKRFVFPYRLVFLVALFIGSLWKLGPVLAFSDIMFGLMMIPTLISTIILSGKVSSMALDYSSRMKEQK
ncbi:Amino-acid carrier protein AlsT [subsurface metagenome]